MDDGFNDISDRCPKKTHRPGSFVVGDMDEIVGVCLCVCMGEMRASISHKLTGHQLFHDIV